MIIIFGIRRLRKAMGPVLLRCANCGMSPVVLLRVSTWFALFFVPVIPFSFKHYALCPNCKRLDQVPKADVDRARAQQDALNASSGHVGAGGAEGQPATLEHAVHEWASVGSAGSAASDPSATVAASTVAHDAATAPTPPSPPSGWYPDPAGGAGRRYWDGQQWTEHTTPADPA